MADSSRSLLERVSQVCVVLTCLAVVWTVSHDHFRSRASAQSPAELEHQRLSRVPVPKNVSGTALLAFLQPGCRFCGASMPFYRDLQEQARKGTSLVGMTSGEEKTLRAYLAGYGVTPDEVVHVRFPEYGVWATPTLQLIDKTGKVLGQWVGQLNSQQEADIKERLLKD